jgi:hypothetical protein
MDEIQNSPIAATRLGRFVFFCVTTILPIASFVIYSAWLIGPDWQSGRLSDYTGIMLNGEVSWFFYPFLIYAIISYALLLYSFPRFSHYSVIRFGIYSGTVLSLQYTILLFVPFPDDGDVTSILFVFFIPLFFAMIYLKSIEKIGVKRTNILTALLLLILIILLFNAMEGLSLLMGVLVLIFLSGPFWNLILFSQATISLLRFYKLSQTYNFKQGLGALLWLSAYIAAWRFAVLKTLDIYAALPTSPPPDCYIATAAAKGHPKMVKSELIQMQGGIARVSPQLRYFKCAELALMTLFPSVHQICRWMYDRVGSRLARFVRCAFVADIVYVSLKPAEWSARFVLKMMIPDLEVVSYRVYASRY